MVIIEVDNSYSKITGLTPEAFKALRKELSYSPDAKSAYFSGGFAHLKYCIDKYGVFPSGLLKRVKRFLETKLIKYDIDASKPLKSILSIKKVDHKGKFKQTPYLDQTEAANAIVERHRGILAMCTASGKSLVAALVIAQLQVRTLVIVPSLEIKFQLIETFQEIFGCMDHIRVENIDSNALLGLTGYDLLIIDEGHHSAAKSYQRLNKSVWKGIYYRCILTATPWRTDTEETLLFEGIAGQIIFELSYKDAVKKKYVAPIEAFYIDLPKRPVEGFTWAQVYNELITNNTERNIIIADLITNLYNSNKSTLCLVKEVKHGQNISDLCGAGFVHGQDDESRTLIQPFSSGKLKALIGTTGVIGEGVNTRACEYIIITGLGKAKSAFLQQVGRAIRTFPGKESGKVIIFRDSSHKYSLSHFNTQKKVLLDYYGVVPIRLDI